MGRDCLSRFLRVGAIGSMCFCTISSRSRGGRSIECRKYASTLEKTKYKLSVFLAPLTHTMRFVGDRRVSETSYGLDEGAWVKHDFGSQVQTNLQWTIIPAIKLTSRLDYLTSYKWVRVEWETNVDFIVTKYISARFYVLARFDDSAAPTVGDDYFQATETFGFGLNYAW